MSFNRIDRRARYARIDDAAVDMVKEADRAFVKHGPEQTMDAVDKTNGERLAILVEEVGEVAKELTYDQQHIKLEQRQDTGGGGAFVELYGWERGLAQGAEHIYFYDGTVATDETRRYIHTLTDAELYAIGWIRTTAAQRLRKELVQVGAMAATWVAHLDATS